MTRSNPIPLRRRCPGSAKNWPSLVATSRSAACEASATFSGWRKPDDVDHQDADAFAQRGCNGNLPRLAQHRDLAGCGARTRADLLPGSRGYPRPRHGRRSEPWTDYPFLRQYRGAEIHQPKPLVRRVLQWSDDRVQTRTQTG